MKEFSRNTERKDHLVRTCEENRGVQNTENAYKVQADLHKEKKITKKHIV